MFDKELLALLGGDRKYVLRIVICNLLTTMVNLLFAMSLCQLMNLLLGGADDMTSYRAWFGIAFLAVMLRYVLSRLAGHFQAVLGSHAKEMLRGKIYQKLAKLGVRETNALSLASLTQVAVEGVEQLDLYYSTYIPQFFYAMISPFILFALMMLICIPSALVLIACVPLIPMSIIAVSRYAKKIFAKYWGQYAKMGDAFLDNISGMKELKIFTADEARHRKMNDEAEEFRKITMKVLTMQLASTTIMDLVAYGGAGIGIAVAVALHMHINPIFGMEAPALLLFIVLTAVDFFLPLRALGSAFHVSMNGATAGRKILTLLHTEEPVWGKKEFQSGDILLRDVSFSYQEDKKLLEHISFRIPQNRLLAIAGKSGCGKSTVISLLSGMRQGYTGEILIGDRGNIEDRGNYEGAKGGEKSAAVCSAENWEGKKGIPLQELDRDSYYAHLGLVSCNSYLFAESVRRNFQMAAPGISDEKIFSYLRMVNLDHFIRENGGLDLPLKEDSVNISGGQRQRLALAIALSAEKEMYFFDEVTSNIDAESEAIIMNAIEELAGKKTIVLVSHRLRNLLRADEIIVLDEGKIRERGSHRELMEMQGLYAELFQTQRQLEDGYKEER